MSDPYLGEIRMFGGGFAPRNWALCNGQLLPISQNTALFSLLGTTYGGDGISSFGLPDLRGRVPMHPGSGPGLSPRTWGEKAGSEGHFHNVLPITGDTSDPASNSAAADSASNMQPYLCVNFIIALQGIYPIEN